MTGFLTFRDRSRDVQDGWERHVWGKQEYTGQGSIIKVRGTDTNDEEANVLNIGGTSFNVKEKFDTEVMLLSSSSDTNMKMALLIIPADKQRRWMEGHGGIQHPTDGEFALDFSDDKAHLTKNKFAVGEKGEFEVKGDAIYMRASKVIITGELVVNKEIKTPNVSQGSENPPGFTGSKQAEITQGENSGGGGGGGSGTAITSAVQLEMNFDDVY